MEAAVATAVNRQNVNIAYVAAGERRGPFNGGTTILGILGGFQAHTDRTTRSDRLRSGEGKIADAKRLGQFNEGDPVCEQLKAAKSFARQAGNIDANQLFSQYPFTGNVGIGGRIPAGATGIARYGQTQFFIYPAR